MPPRSVKAAVCLFLLAFVWCGVRGVEAWPLTGFRLFSHVRHELEAGWQGVTVDAAGDEHAIPFDRLPLAYSQSRHVMSRLVSLDAASRAKTCETWAAAASTRGAHVKSVRIYRTVHSVRSGALVSRTLKVSC